MLLRCVSTRLCFGLFEALGFRGVFLAPCHIRFSSPVLFRIDILYHGCLRPGFRHIREPAGIK